MLKATQTVENASSGKKKGKAEEPKLLVLIDAHAVLHRAYHALPQFTSSRGEPTGGLYGLSTMILKIITTFHPDYIVAAYDLPKPTFRHEAYKAYKEGRAKADEALVSQMIRSREIFGAFNIPIYDKEGFEADDVLGTIVQKIQDSRFKIQDSEIRIVIATGDMDALQLVSDKKVQVFTLKKGINDTILYDEEAVKARFGFGPELLPDFKGLKGDPSDNIKGVAGIGDKTATDLITKFGSVESIYKTLKKGKEKLLKEGVRARTIELLEKGKEEAEFSKLLGTIRRDVPIDFSLPEKLWCESVDLPKAEALFTQLEFRQLLPRLEEAVKRIGNKEKGIQEDTPTTPPRGLGTPPQAGGGEKKPATPRKTQEGPSQASLTDALATSGIPPQELKEASVALWLINSALTNPTIDDIYGFAQTREWKKAREAVFDELKARKLTRVFEDIERPLIPVVDRMNERGVHVDVSYLQGLSREYHKELSLREKDIVKMSGVEFNINSPKQLGEVLFVKMGLKALRQKKRREGLSLPKRVSLKKCANSIRL